MLMVALAACVGCGAITIDGAGPTTYTGPFSGPFVRTTVSQGNMGGGVITCFNTYTFSGTMSMMLRQSGSALTGSTSITGTQAETGKSGDPTCPLYGSNSLEWSPPVSASTSALTFSDQRVSTNGNYSVTSKVTFVGTLSGGVVTGTLTLSRTGTGSITGTTISETGSSTMSVALH